MITRIKPSSASIRMAGRSIKTVYTLTFTHFFAMASATHHHHHHIINMMREMKVNQRIPLEDLFHLFEDESKFYRGRPEMVLMKMASTHRNVQVFRGGKVQILGALSDEEAERMRQEFESKLKRLKEMENCQVSTLSIKNMVVSLTLKSTVNLQKIVCSNKDLSYEVELFPAALIRKWYPIHVALFHNGKMIVTGVRTLSTLDDIVTSVLSHLNNCLEPR
jgi:TATA-box binding protein (TBP) (component of TFIID and TFIIIB)